MSKENVRPVQSKNEQKSNSKYQVTESLEVELFADPNYEFLMTTQELAIGYGVSLTNIRAHKSKNIDDFIEGKHFVRGASLSNTLKNAQPHKIYWTKRGVVRFGYFIRSERAKLFRDWAEDLIINAIEATKSDVKTQLKNQQLLPARRNHNRITPVRMVSILSDIAKSKTANCV